MPANQTTPAVFTELRWFDLELVQALELELFPHDPWTPAMFWSELAAAHTTYWVAKDDAGAVLAYGGIAHTGDVADVQTIAVAPASQGKGLGAQLLSLMAQKAAHLGCERLLLEVRADNLPAQTLYVKHGFTQIAVRKNYYGNGVDASIMQAELL